MAQNNFILNMIAGLQKTKSKQQIKADAKALGDLYVKLIGNLDMPKTRKYIKNQLKGLNNMTFKITPTMNSKGVQNATKQTLQNAQKVVNNNTIKYSFDMDKQKMKNQLKNFATENSRLFSSKEMTAKYNQLLDLSNVAKSKSELNALRKQLSAFRTELIATNKAGTTWTEKFKASIAHFAQYFSGASFIYAMTNQLRNAWTEAKTLDDSLVNLQKVTAEIGDRDSLYKYFDKALNKAQELNVRVGSLIDAITEFKKLGWSLEDAELGGEWATKLSNVGDVDIETAIGSIKTAVASFDEIGGYGNDQMDKKLEAYVDLINNMSNKYSIDAQGLSEAIRLSAGTLTEAHVSIEQAATMFATANRFYGDSSYLGNTAKIGALRMRATSGDMDAIEELQEMGEEIDDLATASSNLREKLLALTGVDIMEDEHTFKSYYDQLYEIAQVMDQLDDTSRANVLETLFGKSRSAGGAAILSGMKESSEAYKDAINSAGSATEEYTTWMQSADAATQRFSNTLTETYQNFINGNTVRDLANMGSAVLDFANSWGIVEGAVKGFLALKIGTVLTNGTMAFISATKQIEQYGKALQLANNIPNGNLAQRYSTLKSIAVATNSLTTAQLKQVLSSQQLSQQDRIRILMMQGMTKEMALQKIAEMNLTQTTNAQTIANAAQTASTFSLKSAMIGLGATIKSVFLSNPIGIALMAISIGVSAVTSAVSNHNQKMDELRDKAKQAADEANTLGDEVVELANKYIALSEAVKTDEGAKESLMTTQTELLKKLGLEGESIDDLIAKYGSLSNAIKQASIDSLKNSQIDLIAGVDAAREELLEAGKDGFWGGNNIIDATGEDAVKAFKELEKAGIVNNGSFGTGGGALVLVGDDSTTEGILENYEKLEKALETLRDSNAFTQEELSNNALFQAIYGRYNELKDEVEAYNSAIDNLNENLAQQTMLTALQGSEIPKTEEDFETFRDELVKTAIASGQFIGSEEEITDAINNYLSSVPEFEGYYSIPLENELDKVNALLEQEDFSTTISDIFSLKDAENNATILSDLSDQLSSVESAYNTCLAAKEGYDAQGYLSVDTLQKVLSLGDEYLQYLFDEEGNVRLDADAFQQLAQARINDMEAQALSNLAENIQQITDEATATEYLTQKQNALASSYADVAANALLALSTIDGFADSEALQGAYNSFKTQYEQVKSLFANTRKSLSSTYTGKAKSSSSKSSSTDPLKEAFTQEYNTLKHNLEMEYITEKQYYDSLNALNQKYFAGKEEYLDEYRKYEEEVYKGLKSYYKDYIEAYIKFQKQSLESGKIDFATYCNTVSNLLKSMFKEGKISAQDYWDYVHDNLESQLDVMDQVIAAVTRRIDKEIDFYQDQQEDIEDRYQTEIDYLDTVIKYYEDQKKALQDANDEKDRQLELEKALWNLRRAQTQRTLKLYTANKGIIYTVDNNAIKDASEEVANAKLDIEIAKLDEAIEKVEQQQNALQDAIDREKEQLQQTIDRLEEYKEQWQSVADEYENAQADMMAQQILGTEWETDIINCRLDILTNFKNQYVALQQAMADAAWNSANEQIRAAQEAAKAASGIPGSAGSVGNSTSSPASVSNSSKTQSDIKWEKQQKVQYEKQENQYKKKKKATGGGSGGKVNTMQRYGTGTKNAKPGYHKVAENGAEIIRDNYGNAFVVEGEQLYPFNGGETVIKASETKEILANADNLVPVENIVFGKGENAVQFTPEELMQKWQSVMPDYASMVNIPKFEMPKFDVATTHNETTPVVQNINLTLPNVTNNSGYERLQKELKQMQIDAYQFAHKR